MKTFEDLEAMLREWVSFADPHVYDAGGMAALFAACLDNMRSRMLKAELEDIGAYLVTTKISLEAKSRRRRSFVRPLFVHHASRG